MATATKEPPLHAAAALSKKAEQAEGAPRLVALLLEFGANPLAKN
jgi:hypothetical protein